MLIDKNKVIDLANATEVNVKKGIETEKFQ